MKTPTKNTALSETGLGEKKILKTQKQYLRYCSGAIILCLELFSEGNGEDDSLDNSSKNAADKYKVDTNNKKCCKYFNEYLFYYGVINERLLALTQSFGDP